MKQLEIDTLDIKSLKIPLDYDFAISRGVVAEAECLLIKLRLRNGVVGYGEAAPMESLTGESLFETRKSILQGFSLVQGHSANRWRYLSRILKEKAENQPAARCALETAILDAFCRSIGIPFWAFLGGASEGPFTTDITLPLLGKKTVLELSDHWYRRGFRIQKIKVGADLDEEMGILADIHRTHPDISFIIDANQAFTVEESILFLQEVLGFGCEVLLYEQPIERGDLEGMASIRRAVSVPVAADESVLTATDLQKVIDQRAADFINLKIMKSGLVESLDLARIATSQGLRLMIGGMVETRLAMGCSLSVAAGLGSIRYLDLDTPLIMKQDYFRGGYQYDGPNLLLSPEPGLGIEPVDFLI